MCYHTHDLKSKDKNNQTKVLYISSVIYSGLSEGAGECWYTSLY